MGGADPEDADEYLANDIFFVPEKARWQYLQDRAKQPEIGKWLDDEQESNPTTLRLAKMNLAIRGIDAKIELGGTFLADKHKHLKADFILANPPFNVSDWSGEHLRDDHRWNYGVPPVGNANYAWLQHFAYKLSPSGTAGIVLANGSMNSNSGGEGEIRKNNHVLMPGRYVGTEAEEDDGIPFDDKIQALTVKLAEQFARGRELETLIRENQKGIGYEF